MTNDNIITCRNSMAIRIEVPEGTSRDKKQRLREGAKQTVIGTLAPKETEYGYEKES